MQHVLLMSFVPWNMVEVDIPTLADYHYYCTEAKAWSSWLKWGQNHGLPIDKPTIATGLSLTSLPQWSLYISADILLPPTYYYSKPLSTTRRTQNSDLHVISSVTMGSASYLSVYLNWLQYSQ